jgi:eukaryotic-like serine/threonine-protein kinase
MALTSGAKLGPYEIQSQLGAGGMGEVYRARDTRLDRIVAVKILPAHLSSDNEFKQRFEREARTVSSLNHPHICQLFDVGREGNTDYLVMEFLDGETLAERVRRGALPLNELLKIGVDIADALAVAHWAGIVHRDLKPGNIMLTKSGAKLMDFGLAKPALAGAPGAASAPLLSAARTMSGPSPVSPLTTAGSIVGTIQYMSPEQIEGREADAASDIFAFGAVVYEMATGRRAFEGKSQITVASAILEKNPEPISAVKPLAPVALDQLVATCLAKDRDERFQSAHDLALQLKAIAHAPQVPTALPEESQTKRFGCCLQWQLFCCLPRRFFSISRSVGAPQHFRCAHTYLRRPGRHFARPDLMPGRSLFLPTARPWHSQPLTREESQISGCARSMRRKRPCCKARKTRPIHSGRPTVNMWGSLPIAS